VPASTPPRILLIDDHALLRAGLRMMLASALPGAAIREADSMDQAMGMADEHPDLVLLDIQMPGLSGIEGLTVLKRQWPQTPVVMLTSHREVELHHMAIAHGAVAFLPKSESPEKMLRVIHAVLYGEATAGTRSRNPAVESTPHLTARQCEVLDQLCRGFPNKVIGRHLNLSENTVRGHVQALLAALGASSRSEAVFAARARGLVH